MGSQYSLGHQVSPAPSAPSVATGGAVSPDLATGLTAPIRAVEASLETDASKYLSPALAVEVSSLVRSAAGGAAIGVGLVGNSLGHIGDIVAGVVGALVVITEQILSWKRYRK